MHSYYLRKRSLKDEGNNQPPRSTNLKSSKRQRKPKAINIVELPTETLVQIFSFFNTRQRVQTRLVCRKFAEVAYRPEDIINEYVREGYINGYDFGFYNEAKFSKMQQAKAVKDKIKQLIKCCKKVLSSFILWHEVLDENTEILDRNNPITYSPTLMLKYEFTMLFQFGTATAGYRINWSKIFDIAIIKYIKHRTDIEDKDQLPDSFFKGDNWMKANLLHFIVQSFEDPDCKAIVEFLITKYHANFNQKTKLENTEHDLTVLECVSVKNTPTQDYLKKLMAEQIQDAQEVPTPLPYLAL